MYMQCWASENAVVVFRPPIIVGSIEYIGMGGLTFFCTETGTQESIEKSSELDIILLNTDFYLEKIPLKSVTDLEVRDVSVGFNTIRMKQCAVKFGELTPQQASQLEYFIQNHTIAEP